MVLRGQVCSLQRRESSPTQERFLITISSALFKQWCGSAVQERLSHKHKAIVSFAVRLWGRPEAVREISVCPVPLFVSVAGSRVLPCEGEPFLSPNVLAHHLLGLVWEAFCNCHQALLQNPLQSLTGHISPHPIGFMALWCVKIHLDFRL